MAPPPPDAIAVEPLAGPIEATVALPGSKSLTNRALVCAGLGTGSSALHHALRADDTEAMIAGLRSLGIHVDAEWDREVLLVDGCGGGPPTDVALVDARLSGTTARFLLPVAALGSGTRRVDGGLGLRARPMVPSIDALRALGAEVREVGAPGHLPVEVAGGSLLGGEITVPGDASSQFVSGLLLTAPVLPLGLTVRVSTDLVSRPYVDMTAAVMRAFGAAVDQPDDRTWVVEPTGYTATTYTIEPDASAASYAWAAAAIVGGSVRVEGLGHGSLQGDVAFVDVLEAMGCVVERTTSSVTVHRTGALRGIDVDMSQLSDTAQTLAVVAAFADTPTRVTGIGFIRHKETDRVAAVVNELRRAGVDATEEPDGFTITPGVRGHADIETYDDHRMAMAFALLGLGAPGIRILDPDCVGKTFPGFWRMLDDLRGPGRVVPS